MEITNRFYCYHCPGPDNPKGLKSRMFKVEEGKIVCIFCHNDNTQHIKDHLGMMSYKDKVKK